MHQTSLMHQTFLMHQTSSRRRTTTRTNEANAAMIMTDDMSYVLSAA